ncbi:hypothetical protein MTBSS4_100010 [Magnetospirillum sp. SS-4]|nr:hypothetical protein MTBSS4_100010 [Magnetospirillum sp. SS-4]
MAMVRMTARPDSVKNECARYHMSDALANAPQAYGGKRERMDGSRSTVAGFPVLSCMRNRTVP